jgi:iron complex transport system permease protein
MAFHLTPRRLMTICGILFGLVLLVVLISLFTGAVPFTMREVWNALFGETGLASVILFQLRLPRIVLALFVGAALSMSGACFQALLRNALADPYVLGVSSGAALGVMLALIWLPRVVSAQPIFGLIGALATTGIVYMLGFRHGHLLSHSLLLAGVISASFLSAVIVFLMTAMNSRDLRSITYWLMGDLSYSTGVPIGLVIGAVLAAGSLAWLQASSLNVMLMGEQEAQALGVDVRRVKLLTYLAASALTAVAVASAGSIGFIGLLVPHLVRLIFGNDYRILLPTSALAGATVLIAADTLARTVAAPTELPVGAVTAVCGAPLFIYLLRRSADSS